MKPTLYYDGSYSLDLSQIKAIKKDYNTKALVFEFKTRAEFLINPETDEKELYPVNETPVAVQFENSDQMHVCYDEVVKEWGAFLKENRQ